MVNHFKHINCKDLEIMISVEGQVVERHPFYYPAIVLIYVKKGVLHLEHEENKMAIERGNFLLINRHSNGFMHKSWADDEGEVNLYAFIFHSKFVDRVKQQFPFPKSVENDVKDVYLLSPNHILKGLFDSILTYVHQNNESGKGLDTNLVELKTLEAMMGILNYHPECYHVFQQEPNGEKINLQQLIENNYMYNIPLSRLAELSGRSLSTFSRDFKAIYRESPHRWIRKRRLLKAKELLVNTNRKPVEFYMELGFESLAHFSRIFKKEFGITMTDFRKNNHSHIQ